MASTVPSGSRKCILIAVEYVGSTQTWNTYATHKRSQVIRELSRSHLIERSFYSIPSTDLPSVRLLFTRNVGKSDELNLYTVQSHVSASHKIVNAVLILNADVNYIINITGLKRFINCKII